MKKVPFELIEKARLAKSVSELLTIAEENDAYLTEEEAAAYYAKLNPTQGEISDDELGNVSGGGCGEYHYCPVCGSEPLWSSNGDGGVNIRCPGCGANLDHDTATGEYTLKQ